MKELVTRAGFLIFLLCVAHAHAEIVFVSDRDGKQNIYVMNDQGGNVRRLTDTPFTMGSIAWSPDGTQIAFTSDLNSAEEGKPQQIDIFIMNADGSHLRNLTEHPALDSQPTWAPDGKSIAFVSYRDNGLDIYTIEVTTRKVRRLTRNTHSSSPAWSPDGKTIAYERTLPGHGRHIYIMNADGSRERPLLRKLRQPLGNTTIFSFYPRWSPDGDNVVYVEGILQPDITRTENTVIVVDKHGRTPHELKIPQKWKVDMVCWTDDGEAVLFAAVPNGLITKGTIFDIYKYRLSDGKITNLSDHPSDNWGMDWTPHNGLAVSSRGKLTTQWARIKNANRPVFPQGPSQQH